MDWTGLSECDQSELGLIVNGDTTDPEALNRLIQHEQEMLDGWSMVDVNAHKIRSVGVHDSTIPKHMQLVRIEM